MAPRISASLSLPCHAEPAELKYKTYLKNGNMILSDAFSLILTDKQNRKQEYKFLLYFYTKFNSFNKTE